MLWKPDPNVDLARKNPHWRNFHREAGKLLVFFDNIRSVGRNRYLCVAFTTQPTAQGGWTAVHLADGEGRTVVECLDDAWRKCGRSSEAVDRLAGLLCGRVVEADEFESLFD